MVSPSSHTVYVNIRLIFSVTGLLVLERNYLEVFPYDNWTSHELPNFEEGEQFMPSICELREGETTRPKLLTEADLVGLMDKNGIGEPAHTPYKFIHHLCPQEPMPPSRSTSILLWRESMSWSV